MFSLLLHQNITIRFLALYLAGLLLFLLAWEVSYQFMPEGLLQGKSAASKLAGSGAAPNLWLEWVKIVGINLLSCSLVVGANFVMVRGRFPLGYLIPLEWFIYYGILLGTNSFSIPMDSPMAPSFAVLGRSGLYEITAYTLVAVATYSISRYRIENQRISKKEKLSIGLAMIILLASNMREAVMVMLSALA